MVTKAQHDSTPSAGMLQAGRERFDPVEAGQRRLKAAMREIESLRRRELYMRRQLGRLELAVEKASQFAYHDELTGLPNRRLLLDRFKQAVAQSQRHHQQVALLCLDLDGFKYINDKLGHPSGDALLTEAAARLTACIRESDTACRYGGDEFIVLLTGIESAESAAAVAQKIRIKLARPYNVGDNEITMTVSIGMAIYPVEGTKCRDLMEVSDRAMYCDKARGPALPRIRPHACAST